jgi:hypothetical protein
MRVGVPEDLLGWRDVDVHRVREFVAIMQDVLNDESASESVESR